MHICTTLRSLTECGRVGRKRGARVGDAKGAALLRLGGTRKGKCGRGGREGRCAASLGRDAKTGRTIRVSEEAAISANALAFYPPSGLSRGKRLAQSGEAAWTPTRFPRLKPLPGPAGRTAVRPAPHGLAAPTKREDARPFAPARTRACAYGIPKALGLWPSETPRRRGGRRRHYPDAAARWSESNALRNRPIRR